MTGLRAALLERRVVEEGVGLRGQDAARERRRLGRVDGAPLDRAVLEPAQHLEEAVDVHRLGQAVLDRLARRSDGPSGTSIGPPGSVSGQASTSGNAVDEQVVRRACAGAARAPSCRSAARSSSSERCAFQRQRVSNMRRGEQRLHEDVARAVGVQVVEDVLQREAVLRAEREHDRLLVGGGLQLEAEADAEALAQREAPGAVDPRAERRVHDELHAAALVEEALEDDALLRRDRAERLPARRDVLGDLDGAAASPQRIAAVAREGGRRWRGLGRRRRRASLRPSSAQLLAQRRRSRADSSRVRPGRLAEPERERRRLALRVGHAHDAGLDPQDRARTRCRAGRCRRRSTRSPSPR